MARGRVLLASKWEEIDGVRESGVLFGLDWWIGDRAARDLIAIDYSREWIRLRSGNQLEYILSGS